MENLLPSYNKCRQVQCGPAGLNIPEIPIDADDQDLLDAIRKLSNAQKILKQRRSALRKKARRVGRTICKLRQHSAKLDCDRELDSNQAHALSIMIHRRLFKEDRYQLTSLKKQLSQLLYR